MFSSLLAKYVCFHIRHILPHQVLRKILSGGAPVLRRSRLEFCVTNDADLAAEGVRASADLATPAFAPSVPAATTGQAPNATAVPASAAAAPTTTAAEAASVPSSAESAPVAAATATGIEAAALQQQQQLQPPPKPSLLKWFTLVNELVIKRALRLSGVAEIDCYINDNHLARFQGDGFVSWLAHT